MLHIPLTNFFLVLLAAKLEQYPPKKNIEEFSRKKSEEQASRLKKDKTEKVTGLSKITREDIVKGNQMTALRFKTGGRHQTCPASIWG